MCAVRFLLSGGWEIMPRMGDPGCVERSRAGYWLRFAALGTVLIVVLTAANLAIIVPFGRAVWDFLFILDGAYRISAGQTPHIHFISPIGPLALYTAVFAQSVFPGMHAFVGFHAASWLMMVPVLAVLAPRFPCTISFLAAMVLCTVMALLPMTLDATHLSEISFFATYNRFATAFLFLGGLWLVLPKRRHDWLLVAYILLVLFFLKITAAIVLLGIVIAAAILGRCNWRDVFSTIAALLVGLIAIQVTTGLTLGYLGDIKILSEVNQGNVVYAVFVAGFRNWIPLTVTAALVLTSLYAFLCESRTSPSRSLGAAGVYLRRESFVIDTALLVGAAWAAESQNTGGLGLIAAIAVLFHPDAWRQHRVAMVLLVSALAFPVADIAVKRSITALSREKVAAPEQSLEEILPGTRISMSTYEGSKLFDRLSKEWRPLVQEIQSARFFLTPDPTSNATAVQLAWFRGVMEAARAFEENGYRSRAQRYTTIAFADPFARLLGLTPAKGTLLVMDITRTVPNYSLEEMRTYLADADGVFLERCDLWSDERERRFETVLQADFEALPLTECWEFHIRKDGA